ncbi:hypothetical protein [Streptomyces sp. GZWMJZ-114]|uniref:hypothetical protein n=1 Tax=Streptomyces sp. GZWMJZ-114 TaxID=2494734 RepID=UPI001F50A024|nr:hypothetical protein [Streptomyces sp. GZWMJZ-114]
MSTEARPLPPTPERPPSPPATAPRVPLPRLRPPGAAGAERGSGETPEAAGAEAREREAPRTGGTTLRERGGAGARERDGAGVRERDGAMVREQGGAGVRERGGAAVREGAEADAPGRIPPYPRHRPHVTGTPGVAPPPPSPAPLPSPGPPPPSRPPRPAQPLATEPPAPLPPLAPPSPPLPAPGDLLAPPGTVPGRLAVPRRSRVSAAVCLVLGLGLVGGAVAGGVLAEGAETAVPTRYEAAAGLWHSVPVDTLFPPVVQGEGAGPGGADRTWTRVAVAPDSGCAHAFDPLLRQALAPVGCLRLLRATYTDATRSHLTTVGLLFTRTDPAGMTALRSRFRTEHLDARTDLLPLPYGPKGTPAEGFGALQRVSWSLAVRADLPVVVWAVSGFADGRSFTTPVPAARATREGEESTVALSGLGHDAAALAARTDRALTKAAGAVHPTEEPPR